MRVNENRANGAKGGRAMICYGQVSGHGWTQEHYETSTGDAARRARQLRKAGYEARTSGLGLQVTSVGLVQMSMVTIGRGSHDELDASFLPVDNWMLEKL